MFRVFNVVVVVVMDVVVVVAVVPRYLLWTIGNTKMGYIKVFFWGVGGSIGSGCGSGGSGSGGGSRDSDAVSTPQPLLEFYGV